MSRRFAKRLGASLPASAGFQSRLFDAAAANALHTAELLADELPRWWTGDPLSYCSAVLTHLSLLERGRQADDRTMVVVHRSTHTP